MYNPKTDGIPGDIIYSAKNININNIPTHYIVFLDAGEKEETFDGAMLTHSSRYGNIPLEENHIEKFNEKGEVYKFQFDHTHVCPTKYEKLMQWQPFELKGRLTQEGLQFILENISKQPVRFPFNKE